MTSLPGACLPRARTDGLVIETLGDETLVYDLRRHRAHCLNLAATLVWRRCDGRTPVAAAAEQLGAELGVPEADDLVWTAVEQLARARLLEEAPSFPAPRSRYARRAVIRALGLSAAAALLAPLVDSVVSPVAAQAGSCVTDAECRALAPPFCGNQPICGQPRRCCRQAGIRCRSRPC